MGLGFLALGFGSMLQLPVRFRVTPCAKEFNIPTVCRHLVFPLSS
jgi:hypothetical protein